MATTVSIIIPTKNEEKYLARCLESIFRNNFPQDRLTIAICDGHSKDHTLNIAQQYQKKYDCIKIIPNLKQTTAYAINTGIEETQSDIVIIMWAHCFIADDFIENCVNFLDQHPEISCVGGRIENLYENDNARIIGFVMSTAFGVGSSRFRVGRKEGFVDTVPFGSYRREIFEKLGYFDEKLIRNQDDEFNYRVRKAGLKIYFSKEIRTYYPVRSDLKKLFKQFYQYGYWKVYVNMKHKQLTTVRQIVPFLFVLFLCGGLAASLYWNSAAICYFSILVLYFLTALLITYKQKLLFKSRLKIVLAFFTLHVAYGFGYVLGVGDFVISHLQPVRKMGSATR